jgi:hypothetical protein
MINRYPVWATFVLLGIACSAPPSFQGTGGDGGTDSGPSTMTACTDVAMAECAALESCSSTIMQTKYGSVATCQTRMAESCMTALAAPSTGNSAAQTEACARSSPMWSCSNVLGNVSVSAACAQAMGGLASGASCAFPAQCTTGFCAIPLNTACGTCATPPKVGDSCANVPSCGQGLVCLPGSKVCGTNGAAGATCGAEAPCGAHLSCIGAKKGGLGTCQASEASMGAACDPTLVTGPGCDYDRGLTCNGMSKTCEPLTISSAGGPCDSDNHQFATCSASGTCSTSEAGAIGTCRAAAQDGQPCSTTAGGPGCLPPARCIVTSGGVSGTCQQDDSSTCK